MATIKNSNLSIFHSYMDAEKNAEAINDPWAPSWLASVESTDDGDIISYTRNDGMRIDNITTSIQRLVQGVFDSQSTPSSLGETLPVIGTPQATVISGYAKQWNIVDDPNLFSVIGGYIYYPVTGSVSTAACVKARPEYTAGGGVNRGGFEFLTDAPSLVVHSSYTSTNSYHVYIDDVFIGTQLGTSGEHNYWTLTFPSRRVRKIRLLQDTGNTNGFFGVLTGTLDFVSNANINKEPLVVWNGDSYCEGALSGSWIDSYFGIVSRELGFKNAWNVAMGGTGLLQKGTSADRPNYRERISDIVTINPTLLIFNLSVNDSLQTPVNLAAEITAYLTALRSSLPDLWIIVTGVAAASLGPTQNIIDGETACGKAIVSLYDPKIAFVPVTTDPDGPWIFGTGYVNATNGSGNSDFYIGVLGSSDSTHPGPDGYRYLAARLSKAIKSQLLKWGCAL